MHGSQAFGKWVQRHAAAPRAVEVSVSFDIYFAGGPSGEPDASRLKREQTLVWRIGRDVATCDEVVVLAFMLLFGVEGPSRSW